MLCVLCVWCVLRVPVCSECGHACVYICVGICVFMYPCKNLINTVLQLLSTIQGSTSWSTGACTIQLKQTCVTNCIVNTHNGKPHLQLLFSYPITLAHSSCMHPYQMLAPHNFNVQCFCFAVTDHFMAAHHPPLTHPL